MIEVDNPSKLAGPDARSRKIEEPVITATILTNEEYVGGILKLVEEKRGTPEELRVCERDARDADV